MRAGLAGAALLAWAALGGCEGEPGEGEQGGPCRFGPEACEADLVCHQGECVAAPGGPAVLYTQDLDITLRLEKAWLRPDGADESVLAFEVRRRHDGAPHQGDVLLRTEPPGARVLPPRVTLRDGKGATRLVACDAARERCPGQFVIQLALAEQAIVVVAQSHAIGHIGLEGGAQGGGPGDPVDPSDGPVPPNEQPSSPVGGTTPDGRPRPAPRLGAPSCQGEGERWVLVHAPRGAPREVWQDDEPVWDVLAGNIFDVRIGRYLWDLPVPTEASQRFLIPEQSYVSERPERLIEGHVPRIPPLPCEGDVQYGWAMVSLHNNRPRGRTTGVASFALICPKTGFQMSGCIQRIFTFVR